MSLVPLLYSIPWRLENLTHIVSHASRAPLKDPAKKEAQTWAQVAHSLLKSWLQSTIQNLYSLMPRPHVAWGYAIKGRGPIAIKIMLPILLCCGLPRMRENPAYGLSWKIRLTNTGLWLQQVGSHRWNDGTVLQLPCKSFTENLVSPTSLPTNQDISPCIAVWLTLMPCRFGPCTLMILHDEILGSSTLPKNEHDDIKFK